MVSNAFNITVMDVDKFIHKQFCQPVTSPLVKLPSSHQFHPDGLFSEDIFGQVNTHDRLVKFGYIDLGTKIISPVLFKMVKALAPWHVEVMAGRQYAIYDNKTNTLEKSSTPFEGNTGFAFYMSIFPKLKFKESKSIKRTEKIKALDRYRHIGVYMRYLVEPAGLRDVDEDDTGKQELRDVNTLYRQMMAYSRGLTSQLGDSSIYDATRFNVQLKAQEIYAYIDDIMRGKKGFLKGHYGKRNIALGTRNVITATNYTADSPTDPQFLTSDETMVGLYQTMKGMQPLVVHYMKEIFFKPIFGTDIGKTSVLLMDTKTLKVGYRAIPDSEKEKFISNDELTDIISKFDSPDFRNSIVKIHGENGIVYYPYIVYDTGRKIQIFPSIDDLESHNKDYDKSKVRPIAYAELLYIATYVAAQGKHCFITRYPVIEEGSCYPSKIHLASTTPARKVTCSIPQAGVNQDLPEYPILGKSFIDGVSLASPRLAGLGADHDGDTVSVNFVMLDESNKECEKYLNSTRALIDTNSNLMGNQSTDLIDYALFALTCTKEDL